MGFWQALFAHTAASMYTGVKKEKKKNKEWNESYTILQKHEDSLNNYLKSLGLIYVSTYTFDVYAIDRGYVSAEINKMDKMRSEIVEYINLGGNPHLIPDINNTNFFEKIETRIKIARQLKTNGVTGCFATSFQYAFENYAFEETKPAIDLYAKYIRLAGITPQTSNNGIPMVRKLDTSETEEEDAVPLAEYISILQKKVKELEKRNA